MRVFGIDCGTETTGFGVVESDDSSRQPRLVCKAKGAIRLAKSKTTPERLKQVFAELSAEMERWQPEVVAIEEVFYSVNAKSALKLGQVRGVALLAAACQGLPVAEYAPLRIKQSVVGYGLAQKEQVQFMVARLLRSCPNRLRKMRGSRARTAVAATDCRAVSRHVDPAAIAGRSRR